MTDWGSSDGVITDVRSIIDSESLANLKLPRLVDTSLELSDVSYPHPWREFKLLKREDVYILDATMIKRRYLGERI